MSIQVTLTFASVAAAVAALGTLSGNAQPSPQPPQPAPATTRYFFQASHNNLYSVAPGQVMPSFPDAVEVTETKYNEIKAALAARFAASQFAASQVVAAPSSVPAVNPAPAVAGAPVDDPFGAPTATSTTAPMNATQFSDALKGKCASAEARTKLVAFLKSKGAANVGALVAGKSDVELGALFVEAAAAVA